MVETVEEGRFELNFYGALAWASSRARVYARSLELSSVLRPEDLAVTLFGCRLFGDDCRKSCVDGSVDVSNPLPGDTRKVP